MTPGQPNRRLTPGLIVVLRRVDAKLNQPIFRLGALIACALLLLVSSRSKPPKSLITPLPPVAKQIIARSQASKLSLEFKLNMVECSYQPGISVAQLAR